jgi:ribosomal-protein-alanine N-acetyltransferase
VFIPTPIFTTQRLVLSPLTELDAPSYERHFIDYEVIRNLSSSVPWPYPENGVATYLREFVIPRQGYDRWSWGIREANSPSNVIGGVELWREGMPEHRGFWLGKRFWGKGYMTEAVKPVMDFAFGPAGFDTLIFTNALGNTRSARIKEKTGARRIRIEPANYVDPTLTSREVWEITKQEWISYRST